MRIIWIIQSNMAWDLQGCAAWFQIVSLDVGLDSRSEDTAEL